MVAVLTEVTAQVQARKELERVNKQLEEFVYVASHDLQEPLRMVNICTQLIGKNFLGDMPEARQYAGFVSAGVARMEALIRDLLTYARTVQQEQLPVGAADLAISLGDALSAFKSRIDESSAVIHKSLLPAVRGDTQQLSYVFQNLLSNAFKYCRRGVAPEVWIGAGRSGGNWIVTVRDSGIGFEPRFAKRIFGHFKRLHKDEYPGTGLGLAIWQHIVERYGGRMWADSRPGEGATFPPPRGAKTC